MKIKKWNKKRKIKNLTTKESGEHPSYNSCTEKPKSRNSSTEELLSEQPFYISYTEKPQSNHGRIIKRTTIL